MSERKFAFESDELSILFYSIAGMGDCVIARKVYDAIIELVPNCVIDFYCTSEAHRAFAKAFYGDSKNLNRLLDNQEYQENVKNYDLALYVGGCHAILFDYANTQRLQEMVPDFWQVLSRIELYNQKNVHGLGPWKLTVAHRNMISAEIIGKNFFHFLSCEGALPINDDKIKIPLSPEYKSKFDELKLGKYITFYTDIDETEKTRPKVKTWPKRYFVEYISRMKKRFPSIEIVQCGGANDIEVENADRHFLGCDLELTKYILANSLLHVGCEGGLVHLATAVGAKCLVLFGSSSVEYFGYERNINLVSEVCRPCMYIIPDFQVCMLGAKEPPCMLNLTPKLVCEVTCNYAMKNIKLVKSH